MIESKTRTQSGTRMFAARLLVVGLLAAGVLTVSPPVAEAQEDTECFVPIDVPDESIDSYSAVLSSDGSRLAYVTDEGSRVANKLVSMALDGSDVQVVADESDGLVFDDLQLSGSGSTIAARTKLANSYGLGEIVVFRRGADGYGEPKVFPYWRHIRLSHNGSIVTLRSTSEVMIWDLVNDQELARFDVPEARYGFVKVLPDGNTVVYSRLDGISATRVISLDLASGTEQTVLSGIDGVYDVSDGGRVFYRTGGVDHNYNFVGIEEFFYVDLDFQPDGVEVSAAVPITSVEPLFADPFYEDWNDFESFELTADGSRATFDHYSYWRYRTNSGEGVSGVLYLNEDRIEVRSWSSYAGPFPQSLSDDGSIAIGANSDGLFNISFEGDCAIDSDLLGVGVDPSGFAMYLPAGRYRNDNYYAISDDRYCVANVTGDEYPVVCWESEERRQGFVDDVLALSPPTDQVLWLGEAVGTDRVPAPVKP